MSHATCGAFEHLPLKFGLAGAALLKEISFRLTWNGGADHDGHHWIYLSAEEAGLITGQHRNTNAKALKRLADLGVLIREKLGQIVGYATNRAWYYRLGPNCPDFLQGNASPKSSAVDCTGTVQSDNNPTSTPSNKKPGRPRKKQQPVSRQVVEERQKAEEAHKDWAGSPAHLEAIARAKALTKGQQPTALTRKNSQRPLQAPVRALASPLGSLTSSSPSSAYTASPGSSPSLSVSPPPSQDSPQSLPQPSTHSSPSTPAIRQQE